jgi:acetyltransferase
LLEYVINYLLKNNIDIIELTVSENNERAINMYLKSRFKIVKKLKNEYGNDGQRYLMRYTKNTK